MAAQAAKHAVCIPVRGSKTKTDEIEIRDGYLANGSPVFAVVTS